MSKYVTTKIVETEEMSRLEYCESRGWTLPAFEDPTERVYKIIYSDGYISMCPVLRFHEQATSLEDGVSFGIALELLKQGKQIARKGWNGKSMYIQLVGEEQGFPSDLESFFILTQPDKSKESGWRSNTWVASVSDLLTNDWMVV